MGALGRGNRLAVRPFRGGQERERERETVSKGVVYAGGSHKGTFRDRRLVIRRRFRKGLFCSRWPRERAHPSSPFTRFSQPPRTSRPIYFRLCSYWSTEISFRLRVISTGAKRGSFDLRRTANPLTFPHESNRIHLYFFLFFGKRTSDTFVIFG